MSLECSECERDMRGPHDEGCSRYIPPVVCKCGHSEGAHDEEGCCVKCDCLMTKCEVAAVTSSSEVPRMTPEHLRVLHDAMDFSQGKMHHDNSHRGESCPTCKPLGEIRSLVESLASRESVTVPLEELEIVRNDLEDGEYGSAFKAVSRWLSSPAPSHTD